MIVLQVKLKFIYTLKVNVCGEYNSRNSVVAYYQKMKQGHFIWTISGTSDNSEFP